MNLRTLSAVALIGAASTFAAGCGTTTIDTAKAEKAIASGIKEQTGFTVTVSCPDDVEAKAGATFTCSTESDGQKRDVTVTQKDDKGNVSWELAK